MVLQKAAHCSPNNTAITTRNTETPSNAAGRTSNSIHLLSINILWFSSSDVSHKQCQNLFSTKIKFTSAMVVLFKYGLKKRNVVLWTTRIRRTLNALIPCTLSMSSGGLERLNSADTFLRRENACTNFLLVP